MISRVSGGFIGSDGVSTKIIPQDNTGSLHDLNRWPLAPQLLQYINVCDFGGRPIRFSIVS